MYAPFHRCNSFFYVLVGPDSLFFLLTIIVAVVRLSVNKVYYLEHLCRVAMADTNYDYDEELMIKIAWFYYIENLTQQEIAKTLGINRIKILRLLEKARATGLVNFQIRAENLKRLTIESRFKETFNLKDVLIVPFISEDALPETLAQAAAMYLMRLLKGDDYINIGYGDTTSRILNYLAQRAETPIHVVSLTGGVNYYLPNGKSNIFNAQLHLIPSPLLLNSSELVSALKKEESVERISTMSLLSDFTVVGIGGMNENSTIIQNAILSKNDFLLLKKHGAVGDILSHFIDIKGNRVDTDLENRLMSPALSEIKKLNNMIGVAGGKNKTEAILAVLNGGYMNVLITDEQTASRVLKLHENNTGND